MNNKSINKIINLYGGNDDKTIYTQSILDKYKNKEKDKSLKINNDLSKNKKYRHIK